MAVDNHQYLNAGKKKVKDMNIYLEPLIDELILLWLDGVRAYDVSRGEDFLLRAILIW
jgi:hypothetical protein